MAKEQLDKKKICMICQKAILLDIDSYVYLADYKEGNFFTDGYYHNTCFNEQWKKAKQTQSIMTRVSMLLDKMGVDKAEEVIEFGK